MIDRCQHCPFPPEELCTALKPSCDRMADPIFKAQYLAWRKARQADREVIPGLGSMPDIQGDSIEWTGGCGC